MKHSNFVLLVALVASSFCSISSSFAVVGGELRESAEVSTVELTIVHSVWSPTDANATATASCSAVVVGTQPLTLLTASHCFRDVIKEPATGLPRVTLKHLPTGAKAELRGAVYHPFYKVARGQAIDLALLVFDTEHAPEWKAARIASVPEGALSYLCGYGFAKYEPRAVNPRCAPKRLVNNVYEFSEFLPASYEPQDPELYGKMRSVFRRVSQVLPADSVVGVNRLRRSHYTIGEPMPRLGDSGGPWFRRGAGGNLEVFALTSFVASLVPQESAWSAAFREQQIDAIDLPYAAYGVRLDTPSAREVFESGTRIGARLDY